MPAMSFSTERTSPACRCTVGAGWGLVTWRRDPRCFRRLRAQEPLAGIDPISVADLQQVIIGLKEKEIGVIITDHNVRDTLTVCDRGYIISEGEILLEGNPEEIASSSRVREIYLGEQFSL